MIGYVANIEELTLANNYFRQVLFTGKYCQLVVMCLQIGEEIGLETHASVDQFFRIESGEGKVIMNGEENAIKDGSAIIVPAGTEHNVINTGSVPLKLYTLYSPPNHKDGIIHVNKAEALADETDIVS